MLFLFILSIIFLSCKKEQTSSIKEQIPGRWYYLNTISAGLTSPLPPDTTQNIFIGHDDSFARRLKDSVIFIGTYSLIEKKDCYGSDNKFLFKTSDQPGGVGDYIKVNGDTLTLSTPNCYSDGGTAFYIKK